MKILITGGNGYIGKSLYSALYDNHDITVVTRQDFDLTCWASTCKFFHDKSFDIVIHTAVAGGHRLLEDSDSIIRENLLMYRNLLNHQDRFTKFISFGSGAELNNPTTPYGISKQAIANHMAMMPDFLNLRVFAVFDENELDTRFIKSSVLRYISGEDVIVHEDRLMDFFYMKDLITLIKFFISKEEWLWNDIDCVYYEKTKLTDIANIINTLSNYRVGVELEKPTQGEPYTGVWRGLPIKLIGLERGIRNVYASLK
jgi:nucleoside-diphosphate-sugar epimerase